MNVIKLKSKTGVILSIIYLLFTLFCTIGFGHRDDLGSVVALIPVLPIEMLFLLIGLGPIADSTVVYILFVLITLIMLYVIGAYIEKLVLTIRAK